MQYTKAAFKAIREECGLSQQDVADEFDLSISAIKKWENPKYDRNNPADEIWQWLLECRAAMYSDAHDIAGEIEASIEVESGKAVVLDYFRTQEDLDAVQLSEGVDEPVGYFNARTRAVARILESHGVKCTYAYPTRS